MGGKMSRNKGARGERAVIQMLQPIVDVTYRRHGLTPPRLQRNSLQSDGGGFDAIALDRGLDWIAIEIKYAETFNFAKWWEQAVRQAGTTKAPVLLYRKNHVPWRCRRLAHEHINGQACSTLVDISIDSFLAWFEQMLNWRLQSLLAEAAEKRKKRQLEKSSEKALPDE